MTRARKIDDPYPRQRRPLENARYEREIVCRRRGISSRWICNDTYRITIRVVAMPSPWGREGQGEGGLSSPSDCPAASRARFMGRENAVNYKDKGGYEDCFQPLRA